MRLVVTVPAERTTAAYSKIVAALRKDYNVPGFRNNEKVPVDMLVQAAGGEKQFKFACVEEVMHSTIEEACFHKFGPVLDTTCIVGVSAQFPRMQLTEAFKFNVVCCALHPAFLLVDGHVCDELPKGLPPLSGATICTLSSFSGGLG